MPKDKYPTWKLMISSLKNFFKPIIAFHLPSWAPWITCPVAVVLSTIGSKYWYGTDPQWSGGAPYQILAILLLWVSFPLKVSIPKATLPKPAPKKLKKSKNPIIRKETLLFLAAVFLLAGLGQFCFFQDYQDHVTLALIFWALALLAFGTIQKRAPETSPDLKPRTEKILLALVLGVAALMRFPFLYQHFTGLQIDESNCLIDAYSFLNGSIRSPFVTSWGENETFHFWWLAHFMRLFGESLAAGRGFSATVSMGVLFVFYFLCRSYFSARASLLATFLMSIGWWYLMYSFSPFQGMLIAFYEMLAFYFLNRALKKGWKHDFLLAGLFMGFGFLEYLSGRLVPFMVGLAVLGILVVEGWPFLKTYGRHLSLAVLTSLWLACPFLLYAWNNPSIFFVRSREINLFNDLHESGSYWPLFTRFWWTFISFLHHNIRTDLRFSALAPQLDALSGALLVFGLLLALLQWRKRISWYALSGLFFGLAANALAIQGPHSDPTYSYINGQRYFLVVPFLFLLTAGALDWLFQFFSVLPSKISLGAKSLLALLVAGVFAWNVQVYYFSMRNYKGDAFWGEMGFNLVSIGEFLKTNSSRCHLLLDRQFFVINPIVIITHGLPLNNMGDDLKIPIEQKAEKNVLMVFFPGDYQGLQNRIHQTYPQAIWKPVQNYLGGTDAMSVEISKEDIEALQKGSEPKGSFQ